LLPFRPAAYPILYPPRYAFPLTPEFGSRAPPTYDVVMSINRASPHDILQAWQAGEITWKRAMRLTGTAHVMELIAAARSSGVEILGLSDLDRELLDRAARLIGNRLDTVAFWQRADAK
jgi:hypothetical protein